MHVGLLLAELDWMILFDFARMLGFGQSAFNRDSLISES